MKKILAEFKKLKYKINPDYVLAIVFYVVVIGMWLRLPALNKPCNQWLTARHVTVAREVKSEEHHVFKMRAHHQIYRYALITYKDRNLNQKIKTLQRRSHSVKRHPVIHHKLVKKQNSIGKMKAHLQILDGQHNLYLLNHPELKNYFKQHKLTKTYTANMKRQNKNDQHEINVTEPIIKNQKRELKADHPQTPTVNMRDPRSQQGSAVYFNTIVGWGAGMIIFGFIGFCFMLHGFDYKRRAHTKRLYGDDKPEASD